MTKPKQDFAEALAVRAIATQFRTVSACSSTPQVSLHVGAFFGGRENLGFIVHGVNGRLISTIRDQSYKTRCPCWDFRRNQPALKWSRSRSAYSDHEVFAQVWADPLGLALVGSTQFWGSWQLPAQHHAHQRIREIFRASVSPAAYPKGHDRGCRRRDRRRRERTK